MTPNIYPLGIQTFSEIREKNQLYIDKTEYIYRMTHGNMKYVFLSRPRRFGKTLNMDMIRVFFEKDVKDTSCYFRDKKISDLPNTTPEVSEIYEMLVEAYDLGYRYAVVEASSEGLLHRRLENVPFEYAIFTNFSFFSVFIN